MNDFNIPSSQDIQKCLALNYDIEVDKVNRLEVGADSSAFCFQATTIKGSNFFVKVKRGHVKDKSLNMTQFLFDQGIHQTITPIKTIQGHLSQKMGDCTLILYPYVLGENAFTCELKDAHWLLLGHTLKKLHQLQIPSKLKKNLRKEHYSSKNRLAVKDLYNHLDKNADDETATKFQLTMKKYRKEILYLVDQAEYLAQRIKNQKPPFVMCHGDIHAGNVLIDENDDLFIVDWDHPIMAPKERDLMFIGAGVGNVWNQEHELDLFYSGYGSCDVDKFILTYYRLERIIEDIAEYGQMLFLNPQQTKNKFIALQHFIDMFEVNGVVEIAIKTDQANCKFF